MKKKLLFLCTGNSCRSQMAEGFAKIKLNQKFKIFSAGIEAHGINSNAVIVMKEMGINISSQQSKNIVEDEFFQYDLIVTLCGDARDRCPVLSNKNNHIHWRLEDPANASGSDEDIIGIYRKVRDQINKNIDTLL